MGPTGQPLREYLAGVSPSYMLVADLKFARAVLAEQQERYPDYALVLERWADKKEYPALVRPFQDTIFVHPHNVFIRRAVHDADVAWYINQIHPNARDAATVVEMVSGDVSLIPRAMMALRSSRLGTVWHEFLASMETGERLKYPVSLVQDCIWVAIACHACQYPPEVMDLVLSFPPYGTWLETHVTQFYAALNGA